MRNFLIIIAFMLMGVSANAQQENYLFTADTVTNAETVYLTYPNSIGGNYVYGIGVTATELSGSATLSAQLEGQIETGVWVAIGDPDTLITSGTPDSESVIFTGSDTPYLRIRVAFTQTGTAATRVIGRAVFKNP